MCVRIYRYDTEKRSPVAGYRNIYALAMNIKGLTASFRGFCVLNLKSVTQKEKDAWFDVNRRRMLLSALLDPRVLESAARHHRVSSFMSAVTPPAQPRAATPDFQARTLDFQHFLASGSLGRCAELGSARLRP